MLAIIPARGGSKGLPGKNLKELNGKPLICYAIEQAKKSKLIDKIVVSTDDIDIANVAVNCGAECPFLRPAHLATDDSLVNDTYIYTLDKLKNDFDYDVSEFIVLQPTTPLRKVSDIDSAIELFKQKDADSVVSYVEESHSVYWHKFLDENMCFDDIFEQKLANRQEYRKSYYPNGAVYIFKKKLILENKWYSDKSFAYLMPRSRSVDIDTLDDFLYAEYLLGKNKNS
jgi:N-acylneuraminate cytidylyltransferase/CMP-N,N'-diacetyllegionaminic acid synthase